MLGLGDALERFRSSGGIVEAYVGVDMTGTSYEALCVLLQLTDDAHSQVHAKSAQTFHPKLYSLESDDEAFVIVGSASLTGGGLWRNVETSMSAALDLGNADDYAFLSDVNDLFEHLSDPSAHPMTVGSVEDVDTLLSLGLVRRECSLQADSSAPGQTSASSPFAAHIGPCLSWGGSRLRTRGSGMEGGSGLLPRRATPSSARATRGCSTPSSRSPSGMPGVTAGRPGFPSCIWMASRSRPKWQTAGETTSTSSPGRSSRRPQRQGQVLLPGRPPPMLSRGLCLQGMRGGAPVLVCRHIPLRAR